MKAMRFRGLSGPGVLDRQLRASDLPIPTTNADADRISRDRMGAKQIALMRMSGFGGFSDGEEAIASGAAAGAGFDLAMGAGMGRAVVVGVGVMVGATLTLRLIDSIWGRR